jgi:hypothetical protein
MNSDGVHILSQQVFPVAPIIIGWWSVRIRKVARRYHSRRIISGILRVHYECTGWADSSALLSYVDAPSKSR